MFIGISKLEDHSISVDQARCDSSIVEKYLDSATIKETSKLYKTTLTHDMIFTKEYDSTSDKQVELISREYNIHYIDFVGSLIYLLYKRMDLCFAVQNLEKFSSNNGKVHFEGLVHLLRYIREMLI